MAQYGRGRLSANLVNASMLMYIAWLMLPAVQTTLRAVTGVLAVGLLGAGVLAQPAPRAPGWRWLLPRLGAACLLPLGLFFFLQRGGGNLPAYAAQQGMFWFPPLWCAYAGARGERSLYRFVMPLFMAVFVITTLTTAGWLVQGLLRGGKVYAYARSLGSGEPGNGAYLRELMGRNIGGYDFIYASLLALPVTFALALREQGWKRIGYAAFYGLQLGMIGLSQYTYAILFAGGVTAVQLFALLLRAVFRKLPVGASLWLTLPLLATVWLLRVPLLGWAAGVAAGFGFQNAAYSLRQLLAMLTGGAVDAGSRLATYTLPLQGFAASPWVGSMAGGVKRLGMHSDLLDLLSGMGVLGTAAFALGAWLIGRGGGAGLRNHSAAAPLVMQWVLFGLCMLLGTVFYSRELPLLLCISGLILQPAPQLPAAGGIASHSEKDYNQ